MANVCFVFFYFFSDSAHEHVPVVHLQKLWPFQRPAFVNFLNIAPDFSWVFQGQCLSFFEKAGHIDDGQSVFVCFSALTMPHSVVWKKKKVCLVNCIWRGHIEFRATNVFWCRKINLLKKLLVQPFFCVIFGNLCSNCELFDGGNVFPIALRVAVSLWKFFIHPILIYGLNFWLFVVNRRLHWATNSQIRQNCGECHKNCNQKCVVMHQMHIFMHKAWCLRSKRNDNLRLNWNNSSSKCGDPVGLNHFEDIKVRRWSFVY